MMKKCRQDVCSERRQVVILWDSHQAVEVLGGLQRYTRGHHLDWDFLVVNDPHVLEQRIPPSRISALVTKGEPSWPSDRGRPVLVSLGCPQVPSQTDLNLWFDDVATGETAALYLMQRGYRSFACITYFQDQVVPSYRRLREQAFRDTLAKHRGLLGFTKYSCHYCVA